MSKTDSLHYQLCLEGAKWLHRNKRGTDAWKKCPLKPCHKPEFCRVCRPYLYVAVELCTWGSENTDVWGLGAFGDSAVIEVKTSHADFVADRKKWCRSDTATDEGYAAGRLRWYLCPEGVIKPEELPEKWGLLYWNGKKVIPIIAPTPFKNTGRGDIAILMSLLRREDFPKKVFNYRGAPTTIHPKTTGNE
jgi:hypothetical protein